MTEENELECPYCYDGKIIYLKGIAFCSYCKREIKTKGK
jgi:uncharacterized Zn-finger protein